MIDHSQGVRERKRERGGGGKEVWEESGGACKRWINRVQYGFSKNWGNYFNGKFIILRIADMHCITANEVKSAN